MSCEIHLKRGCSAGQDILQKTQQRYLPSKGRQGPHLQHMQPTARKGRAARGAARRRCSRPEKPCTKSLLWPGDEQRDGRTPEMFTGGRRQGPPSSPSALQSWPGLGCSQPKPCLSTSPAHLLTPEASYPETARRVNHA